MKVEAEAKCVNCGHKWWLGPGGVEPDDMPVCPECHGVGVSTGRARAMQETDDGE